MDPEFWHRRWQEDRIPFHEGRVNRHLEAFWPQIAGPSREGVFVPLCGKAVDLAWLRARGHPVIGVELSERACRAFFTERGIEPEVADSGAFRCFSHDSIQLFCGDFFDLEPHHLQGASLLYDRAALIALPPEVRPRYCAHLAELMGTGSRGLLITLHYPPQAFGGPPFAVSDDEVFAQLGSAFRIERLHTGPLRADDPLLARGLQDAGETVFSLRGRTD